MSVPASANEPKGLDDNQLLIDPKSRRRIQNRNAQRKSRHRRATQSGSALIQDAQQTQCPRCFQHQEPHMQPILPMEQDLGPTITVMPPRAENIFRATNQDFEFDFDFVNSPNVHQHDYDLELYFDSDPKKDIAAKSSQCTAEQALLQDTYLQASPDKEGTMPRNLLSSRGGRAASAGPTRAGLANLGRIESQSKTPLHVCSAIGNHKIVEILLQGGAEVDVADEFGRTALYYGAKNGHTEVVRILLQSKADPHNVDHQGNSIMYVAVANNKEAIVVLLLEQGVDPNI